MMLKLINLVKKFGAFTAVNNINLELFPGDFFGFIGPNGAGKTTTIKMITGLYTPSAGKVLINGIDISLDPVKAKTLIGYIPDQPFLYEKLTGREFLFFSGGLYSIPKNILTEEINHLIDTLQIGVWIDKRTEEYSQGMKQRIVIASALLHDPPILVVDEPMVGLDPQSSLAVKNILTTCAAKGTAIFMSTHSLHVAEELCTRFGIIKDGCMIFEGNEPELEKLKGSDHKNLESLFLELTR
jgi:ABC-2 type transport system ATP-binding protein